MLPGHIKVAVHVLNGDAVLFHQCPAQGGSVGQGGLAGLVDTVPDGIAHLDADGVGVGDDPMHGPAAGLVGVGILAATHRPGHLQVWHRPPDRGIVHEIVGGCLDDVLLEVRGIIGRLVPIISSVMEDQVLDLAGVPGTAVVPGVRQLLLYRVAHLLSLPSCLITWFAPVAARPLTMPTAAAVM